MLLPTSKTLSVHLPAENILSFWAQLSRLNELYWYTNLKKIHSLFSLITLDTCILLYNGPCFANAEEWKKKHNTHQKSLRTETCYISWLIGSFTYLKSILSSRYSGFLRIRIVKNVLGTPVWVLSWCSVTVVNKICSDLSHLFYFCLHISFKRHFLKDTSFLKILHVVT